MIEKDPKNQNRSRWDEQGERGSRLALRLAVWTIRLVGYRGLRLLLAPVTIYYCLFDTTARRASQGYLARIAATQGRDEPIRMIDTYRHLYSFAEVLLDRMSLWFGSIDEFEVRVHGQEHMKALVENKSGALLVGAHIGSFDVLRVVAREANIPVNVVMHSANAERINAAFEALDPDLNVRVIDFDPSSAMAGFEIRQCIKRGEFVAILGDRVRPGGKSRIAYANFLGKRAAFPQGPLLLPQVIQIPVILTFAIRTGPRAYDVYLEPLADGTPVPARRREEVIQERVEHYAARLEHYCKMAPLQWFNFYDFWAEVENARR